MRVVIVMIDGQPHEFVGMAAVANGFQASPGTVDYTAANEAMIARTCTPLALTHQPRFHKLKLTAMIFIWSLVALIVASLARQVWLTALGH